jgi:hypothetical protein
MATGLHGGAHYRKKLKYEKLSVSSRDDVSTVSNIMKI